MKKRMLVADDVELNREILKAIFEPYYEVFDVDSGENALQIIKETEEKIDIVLLDLFMNGMTGFDVLKERMVIPSFQKIPVVVITGSSSVEDQVKSFELGANEYIAKPFDPQIVLSRVNNVLNLNQRVLSARKEAEKLKLLSETDEMTGLLNKKTTELFIDNILRESKDRLDVMLMIDIDHFKVINDTFGHQSGDAVIEYIASILSDTFRQSDVVGRFGGDEFCVLLVGIPNIELARKKVRHILKLVQYSSKCPITKRVTLSIGMATNDRKNASYSELLKKADEALYLAKENGKAHYREYGVDITETQRAMISMDYGTRINELYDIRTNKLPDEKSTVLLVEDQQVNRLIIKKILADKYIIIEAENGQEALELIETEPKISVILLDIVMPVMDGYTVLQRLKKMKKDNIPVIVLTGDLNTQAEEKALDLGAIDFISKPITPKILLSRLRNAIIRNQAVMLEQLRKKSELDDLTGLYNRRTMFANVKKLIYENSDRKFAFVRFDIDQFRVYNSAMGEVEGNRLLQFVANAVLRMSEEFDVCTYGRVDADIFCMCAPYDKDTLLRHAQVALNEMQNYREDYTLSVSFGVYVISDRTESVESMFTKASMAAEKCKNQYDKPIEFFEESMEKAAKEEIEITNRMTTALNNKEFLVYLQPKYDLNAEKPCGAEALVRWDDPKKGMVSPGSFIGIFERNGFIAKLDYYMWESVCKLLHKWKNNGMPVFPISVNISRVSLHNVHLPELIKELVEKYDVEPKYLQLEITESAYMSNPCLMKTTIDKLHSLGFEILMDDFGSGYSSLNTLADINVDILKIDMKFMPHSMKETKRAKILSAVIRMAGWLGMPVIAEGVETKEQRDYLKSIGCGFIQGFYYAKPMPIESFEDLVKEEPKMGSSKDVFANEEIDLLWTPNPQINGFLKGISLPIAIYECSFDEVEVLRVNDLYLTNFNMWKPKETREALGDDNSDLIIDAIHRAADTDIQVNCQFETSTLQGKKKYYQLRLLKIGSSEKTSIICGIFCDISESVLYKEQLQKIERLLGYTDKKKLLVVDDTEVSRGIIRNMFQDRYEILEAKNGREGIEILKKSAKDIAVILLDLIMPELDGEGFLKEKNELEKAVGIPVVVISSETATNTQIKMLQLGVNDYVTKPFNIEVVEERIKNVIAYNSRFQKLVLEYRNK